MSTVLIVSLNRCEQLLFDYVEKHPEERHYWLHKVRGAAELYDSIHLAAERLDAQLWHYFLERATVVPDLREFTKSQGQARTSMKNLAEYLLRLWVVPKSKLGKAPGGQNP